MVHVYGIRERGANAGASAPATGHSPAHILINIDRQLLILVVHRHCIFEVLHVSFCGAYVLLLRDGGRLLARRRRQPD